MANGSITLEQAARLLMGARQVQVLSHRSPDGDTLGAGFALCRMLRALGREAWLGCPDPVPPRFSYLGQAQPPRPDAALTVAVDVADAGLLGAWKESWGSRVDLCIDHHGSNTGYARQTLLDPEAAATCQLMLCLLEELERQSGTPLLDAATAACLYTGLTTDTGCFRYANTTAATHRAAARLMEAGAPSAWIDQQMFETISPARFAVENAARQGLELVLEGRCALLALPRQLLEDTGCPDDELEELAGLPRQLQGVQVGVTLRENPQRTGWRVSVRTRQPLDASGICAALGGGGHRQAAGCFLTGPLEEARQRLLEAVTQELLRHPALQTHTGEGGEPWTAS